MNWVQYLNPPTYHSHHHHTFPRKVRVVSRGREKIRHGTKHHNHSCNFTCYFGADGSLVNWTALGIEYKLGWAGPHSSRYAGLFWRTGLHENFLALDRLKKHCWSQFIFQIHSVIQCATWEFQLHLQASKLDSCVEYTSTNCIYFLLRIYCI